MCYVNAGYVVWKTQRDQQRHSTLFGNDQESTLASWHMAGTDWPA